MGAGAKRFLFTCAACHKRTYPNRKEARAARRGGHPGSQLAAYECPTTPGWWHLGHSNPWLRDTYRRSA